MVGGRGFAHHRPGMRIEQFVGHLLDGACAADRVVPAVTTVTGA